jgi:predicted membrane protein
MNDLKPNQIIFGGFFLLLGVSMLLQQFIPGLNINFFGLLFPGMLILAGVSVIYRQPRKIFLGGVFVFLGLAWAVNNLFGLSFLQFWPVVFILIGASIIFGKTNHAQHAEYSEGSGLNENVIFWGLQKRVVGEFKHGEINAIFGGAEIDMREAKIADNATLDCNAVFGGVSLMLPKDVKIDSSGTGIFGGFSDQSHPTEGAHKTLRLTGAAIFGGVEVKN